MNDRVGALLSADPSRNSNVVECDVGDWSHRERQRRIEARRTITTLVSTRLARRDCVHCEDVLHRLHCLTGEESGKLVQVDGDLIAPKNVGNI